MMNNTGRTNIIQDKTYKFALKIIKLYQFLSKNQKEYVLSGQILRSGTSIGANVEEALGGTTKKDFASKIQISYREARETIYWLNLLSDSNIIEKSTADELISDCNEILKILSSIRMSALKSINNS